MTLSEKIKDEIKSLHLLDHPFYQAWNRGELSRETLKDYCQSVLQTCASLSTIYQYGPCEM